MKLASVSIDLDAIACYFRIHALGDVPEGARTIVLHQCLPRFAELFAELGIKATFFVVGQDLDEDPEGRRLLAELAGLGHELANHSFTHPYELVRLPRARIAEEIDRAHAVIGAAANAAPVGFRCPGYEVSNDVIALLAERAYAYDSSAFPSLPYYGAKAAVMGVMKALGRTSGSILGSPRVLLAPREPYRPSHAEVYRRGDAPLWELPMAVTPWLSLPVIGTSIITFPEVLRRRMVASALRAPFFNLELHGIDLADADADGVPAALVAKQPDLRVPLSRKLGALRSTLVEAQAAGARFVPLAEATRILAAPPVSPPTVR